MPDSPREAKNAVVVWSTKLSISAILMWHWRPRRFHENHWSSVYSGSQKLGPKLGEEKPPQEDRLLCWQEWAQAGKMLSFLSPCPLMGITTRCCHTEMGLSGLCSKTSHYVISHSSSKMDGVCQTQASLSWTTFSDDDSLIVQGKIIIDPHRSGSPWGQGSFLLSSSLHGSGLTMLGLVHTEMANSNASRC